MEEQYLDALEALKIHEYAIALELLVDPAMADYKDARERMSWFTDYETIGIVPESVWQRIRNMAQGSNPHPFAEFMMSRYHNIIDVNWAQAFEYSWRSAEAGSPYGEFALAKNYELGLGVERNEELAHHMLDDLANRDFPWGMAEIGRYNLFGIGRQPNIAAGLDLLKRGFELGYPRCTYWLGMAETDGSLKTILNVDNGRKLLNEVYAQGYPQALATLSRSYLFNVDTDKVSKNANDIQHGVQLLEHGIATGNPDCLYFLAHFYIAFGDEVADKRDKRTLHDWLLKAAALYNRNAADILGDTYHFGYLASHENQPEAWKWYKFASDRSSGYAKLRLGQMCVEGYAQDGMGQSDGIRFFEDSIYQSGPMAGEAALCLYSVYAPADFAKNFPPVNLLYRQLAIEGVEKDYAKALQILRMGIDNDNNTCRYLLGCALTDIGRPYADAPRGVELLKDALASSSPCNFAGLRLYEVYTDGIGVSANEAEAEAYLRMAIGTISADDIADWHYKPYINKCRSLMQEAQRLCNPSAGAADILRARVCLDQAKTLGVNFNSTLSAFIARRLPSLYHDEILSDNPDFKLLAQMCYADNGGPSGKSDPSLADAWQSLSTQLQAMHMRQLQPLSSNHAQNTLELTKCWHHIVNVAPYMGFDIADATPLVDESLIALAEKLYVASNDDAAVLILLFVDANRALK